ncbi:hypothetical protein [Flagellimonas hadalis]|uniref:hypothetical protein n=1 Tax=Flagellimonas hadalis TaxID=2597517 RepID=UPI0018659370|nr:hypothetical protein [Allomuricauda hadalis]
MKFHNQAQKCLQYLHLVDNDWYSLVYPANQTNQDISISTLPQNDLVHLHIVQKAVVLNTVRRLQGLSLAIKLLGNQLGDSYLR